METKQTYTNCDGCGKKLIAYEEDGSDVVRHCQSCVKKLTQNFEVQELTPQEKKDFAENVQWMTKQRVKQLNEQLAECNSELEWSKDPQTNDYRRGRVAEIECELEAIQ